MPFHFIHYCALSLSTSFQFPLLCWKGSFLRGILPSTLLHHTPEVCNVPQHNNSLNTTVISWQKKSILPWATRQQTDTLISLSKSFRKILLSNVHQLLGICHMSYITTFSWPPEFGPFQNLKWRWPSLEHPPVSRCKQVIHVCCTRSYVSHSGCASAPVTCDVT